ncbi:MAG: GGDEF domain-containing protein [Calditrichaeota bacterium]|nr:MAG: GGDEF domain-containing protein [Calditrichota bacterium]
MVKEQLAIIDDLSDLNHLYQRIAEVGQDVADKILEIYSLYQIASTLSGKMDMNSMLRVLENLFKNSFRIHKYAFILMHGNSQKPELLRAFGFSRKTLKAIESAYSRNLFAEILEAKKSYYIDDTVSKRDADAIDHGFDKLKGSLLFVPVLGEKDELLAVIHLYRDLPFGFSESEIQILERLGRQIGQVMQKILLYQHTKELSITDELTKIFNRRYFNQRFEREMQRAIRYNRPLCIIMADIDHFKSLNDTYGHFYGDEILKTVASILETNLRKADILARFGGEEFVIILPEIDKSHGYTVAEKLRQAIESHPFEKGSPQNDNRITISLGLAAYPQDALMGEELLEIADKALYLAKSKGRNRVATYHKKNGLSAYHASKYRLAAAGTRA